MLLEHPLMGHPPLDDIEGPVGQLDGGSHGWWRLWLRLTDRATRTVSAEQRDRYERTGSVPHGPLRWLTISRQQRRASAVHCNARLSGAADPAGTRTAMLLEQHSEVYRSTLRKVGAVTFGITEFDIEARLESPDADSFDRTRARR